VLCDAWERVAQMEGHQSSNNFAPQPRSRRRQFESFSKLKSSFNDAKLRQLAETIFVNQNEKENLLFIENFRLKTKEFLTHSVIGEFYNNILLLASVFSCGQYLYGTYQKNDNEKDFIELGIAIVFTLDWCLNCFIADHKVLFFTR
jgi:hypothetical protein